MPTMPRWFRGKELGDVGNNREQRFTGRSCRTCTTLQLPRIFQSLQPVTDCDLQCSNSPFVNSNMNQGKALSLERSTLVRLLAPELGHKEDEDSVDLQSSQEHAKDEQPFAQHGDVGIVVRRAHQAQAWSDVSDGGGHGRK